MRVTLWQVDDLERYVDRRALLAGDDPEEPPYWAHLWSGARVLADAVPARPGRTIELGCGLGLPGLTAARRGGARDLRRSCARPAGVRAGERGGRRCRPGRRRGGRRHGRRHRRPLRPGPARRGALRPRRLRRARASRRGTPGAGGARAAGGRRAHRHPGILPASSRRSGCEVETTSRRVEADGVTEAIALSAIRWPGSAPRPAPGHSPYFSILR